MATFKQIMDDVHALAKKQCCTKSDDSPPDFEPMSEEDFEKAQGDTDIALLSTKEGYWAVGQPTPIIPELSVIFIYREYDEDGDVVPESDAKIYCIPTAAETKKGAALFPTRITIRGEDILKMGEGMGIETWKEEAAAEIVDFVFGSGGSEEEEEEAPPEEKANGVTPSTQAAPAS